MAEQKKPNFDSIKQTNVYGSEYWSARNLMSLFGYDKWERFEGAIRRAMKACEQAGYIPDTHFPSAGKVVQLGSGSEREVKDYHLSRFACYLIAQNGDPRKPDVAAAQAYFAVSTRKNEIHELCKTAKQRKIQAPEQQEGLFTGEDDPDS